MMVAVAKSCGNVQKDAESRKANDIAWQARGCR